VAGVTENWQLKLPQSLPRLGEIELEDCRYPREHSALIASLLVLAGVVVLALYMEKYEVLLSLVLIWLSMVITAFQARTYYRLSGAEVTNKQFPEIHALAEKLVRRFRAPETRIFVVRNYRAEAHAYGFRAPYVIVLHSALLDTLEPEELRCKMGEQFAKIVFGHTRMAILLGGDINSLPSVLAWIAWLRDLVFAWYRRAEVISEDRASIVACNDVRTALRTQIKLSVGSTQFQWVREDELVEQARRVNLRRNHLQTFLITLQSSTPPLILRLATMVEWGGLPPRMESRDA
jgi:Zn-dependent protease with chaperone function